MDYLLHSELLRNIPVLGNKILHAFSEYISNLENEVSGKGESGLSVVIRTKNDMKDLPTLLSDIAAQDYGGKVEVILVDTESTDGTLEYARDYGCKVLPIKQKDFTYPKALNIGFAAASQPNVLSLVGHSALSNRLMFRAAARWAKEKGFGGVYGFNLPNHSASRVEKWAAAVWASRKVKSPTIETKLHMGVLGANAAIISRAAWEKLGGFDEAYAAGGEDTALARSVLQAGMLIVHEPACLVYHSHGLGLVNSVRQMWHWRQVYRNSGPFDERAYGARRPDMRK